MAHPSWNPGEFLNRHRLPDSFAEVAGEYYVPLATWLYEQIKQGGPDTFFLGINGAQGTGKTTLVQALLKHIDEDVTIGLISNAQGGRGDLLRWVLSARSRPRIRQQPLEKDGRR